MPAGKNDETKSASFYAKWERMRQELKSEPLQVLLAVLHQKFEQVLDLVPNLDRINDLSEIPGEKSKVVKNLLWEIAIPDMLRLEEEMDGLISQGVLHKVKGPGAFSYYMDVYKPRRKKTQQLLGFKSADALARHENSIKSTLETVIETSDLYIDRLDEELAESSATKSDMYYIIRRGNRIMHWPKSKWANIEDLRSKQKADAQKCLAKTRKIISALYRSPPLWRPRRS